MSAVRGKADTNDAKADMPAAMSAVEGRADVVCQELSGPFRGSSEVLLKTSKQTNCLGL